MRIAIDARLNAYRQGGIPQYTRLLLGALAEVAPDDEFIALQHREQLRPLVIAPNVRRRPALTPPHHRFEQWALPLEVLLARPHVLHCPDFIAPTRRPCPAVVTIHDLAFMHYPEILDDAARAYYGQVRTNAARADGIIAVSEATRQDIAQFLDLPIELIDVIHEAAAPLYQPLELRPGEARVLNGTPVEAGSFLLFVSTLEPRKNLPTLLKALRICLDRQPDAEYRLVVVGRRGWRDDAIFAAVRDLQLGDHVLFAGGVGQYDLRWLYNACRLYINPSLYEGFGLPLLEAMACGAACLAAATSSLPEIGGSAALYVPPLDAAAWADEIAALWDNEERRAELGRLGLARAHQFSWVRAARETLAVYRRAAERRLPSAAIRPIASTTQQTEPADALFDMPPTQPIPPAPGGPRSCARCGHGLVAGQLQARMLVRAAGSDDALAPRLWACAQCGYVELVVDWAAALAGRTDGEPARAESAPASTPAGEPAAVAFEPAAVSDREADSAITAHEPSIANDGIAEAPPNTAGEIVEAAAILPEIPALSEGSAPADAPTPSPNGAHTSPDTNGLPRPPAKRRSRSKRKESSQ